MFIKLPEQFYKNTVLKESELVQMVASKNRVFVI